MRLSINWLKQYVEITESPRDLADMLTMLGFEAEVETDLSNLKNIVTAKVESVEKHPNADKLSLCKVNDGNQTVSVVCGAPNVAEGQIVVFAKVGAVLPGNFKITKAKIRGEVSFGMICAEDELGLGEGHDGIMILSDSLEPGTPCSQVFELEGDEVFEIGLTPNRADAMSHYGVARDLKAGLKQKEIEIELITPSTSHFHITDRSLKLDVSV